MIFKRKNKVGDKKQLLINTNIYISILLVLIIGANFGLYFLNKKQKVSKKDSLINLKQKNQQLDGDLIKITEEVSLAEKYAKVFNYQDLRKKDFFKLDTTNLVKLISTNAQEFNIFDLNVKTSEATLLHESTYKNKIYSKDISLKFKCFSEHDIFSFIKNLKDKLNCFITIDSIQIIKLRQIDKVFVQNTLNNNLLPLLEVDLNLNAFYLGN